MAEHHDDVRFEPRDVRIGPIVGFLAILGFSMAVIMVVLWLAQSAELRSHHHSGKSSDIKGELPPEPRIEGVGLNQASHSVTNQDLATSARSLRMDEDKKLTDGWTDAAGKKHPPIEQAMKSLLARLKKEGQK